MKMQEYKSREKKRSERSCYDTRCFFDIGGTVHTQDATPESDRDYIRRLWCFLHMNHIYTAETPEQLLEHINAGAKAYKSYTEQELIELPPDMIWQKFFLKDFDIPAEKLAGLGEELCYMFDRYRKHIVKREGLKETLEAPSGSADIGWV